MYIIYLFLLEFLSSFLEDKNGAQKCNLESHDFHQVFLVRKLWGGGVCVSVSFAFYRHFTFYGQRWLRFFLFDNIVWTVSDHPFTRSSTYLFCHLLNNKYE